MSDDTWTNIPKNWRDLMKFNDSDEKNQISEGSKRWFIKGIVGKNGLSCGSHRMMSLGYNIYEHICINISKN